MHGLQHFFSDLVSVFREAMVLEEGKKVRNNTRKAAVIVGN